MRQERISQDWTQEYVAAQVGITKGALHNIETGQRYPSFHVLFKLENLFGMGYRDLFNLPPLQRREEE